MNQPTETSATMGDDSDQALETILRNQPGSWNSHASCHRLVIGGIVRCGSGGKVRPVIYHVVDPDAPGLLPGTIAPKRSYSLPPYRCLDHSQGRAW
jgi:hypothetical protein